MDVDTPGAVSRLCLSAQAQHARRRPVGRIIVANRHGHQVVTWPNTDEETDTEEARQLIAEAERIVKDARDHGCMVSKLIDGQHVIDRAPFDPKAEEYQIVAPIAGG